MYFIQPNTSKIFSFQYAINIQISNEILDIPFFGIKSLKPGTYVTLTTS